MSILNKLKNLFKKEDSKEIESPPIQIEEPKVEIRKPIGDEVICQHCGMPIYGDQKIKTFNSNKYHLKPCFRDLMKEAKRMAMGQ